MANKWRDLYKTIPAERRTRIEAEVARDKELLVRQKHKYGCTVAAIAMVTGLSYEEIAAHSTRDFSAHSMCLEDWLEFLNGRGFAFCVKYRVTHLRAPNTRRSTWPLPPFAPIHLINVQIPGIGGHAVVMLDNGGVLDPNRDGLHTLGDYPDVLSMIGVWKISAPSNGGAA